MPWHLVLWGGLVAGVESGWIGTGTLTRGYA
jgi:hypothetical protein